MREVPLYFSLWFSGKTDFQFPVPGAYRGTSLIRNRHPVGPYSRTMSRLLWRSLGGDGFS